MYAASVGDELAFDAMMERLPRETRESVERVLASRGYGQRITPDDIEDARDEGYRRGLKDGKQSIAKAET